jgi:hypothetical protein
LNLFHPWMPQIAMVYLTPKTKIGIFVLLTS